MVLYLELSDGVSLGFAELCDAALLLLDHGGELLHQTPCLSLSLLGLRQGSLYLRQLSTQPGTALLHLRTEDTGRNLVSCSYQKVSYSSNHQFHESKALFSPIVLIHNFYESLLLCIPCLCQSYQQYVFF